MIQNAQQSQFDRYSSGNTYNASLSSNHVQKHIKLTPEAKSLLSAASSKLGLSARSYFKVIKLARTIADMEMAPTVEKSHVGEALQYRGQTS